MSAPPNPLLFSLKPCYADLVFDGLKRTELRRRALKSMKGRDVFVYVSSPVMKLRGGFRIGEVWAGTPEEVWDIVSHYAGVDRDDFNAYYAGRSTAYALEITEVWEYSAPVDLNTLRDRFPDFVVPQSWRYAKREEYQSFRRMKLARVQQAGIQCVATEGAGVGSVRGHHRLGQGVA